MHRVARGQTDERKCLREEKWTRLMGVKGKRMD